MNRENNESNTGQSYHPQLTYTLSGSCLTLVSLNIEGLIPEQKQLISKIVREYECEVQYLQETHEGVKHKRSNKKGITLITEWPYKNYGSALFVKINSSIKFTALTI